MAGEHPYPDKTRVRHRGQQWPGAEKGTATVLQSIRQGDGTFEYEVLVDKGISWPTSGKKTWWASYTTYKAI
jgi:hypothetical protein